LHCPRRIENMAQQQRGVAARHQSGDPSLLLRHIFDATRTVQP